MDFHSLSRKELQTLCKKNKIPANITNVAMADALSALPHVEGLDEFLNPIEAEGVAETPISHRGAASRTATRKKPVREEPPSSKVVPSAQRPQRGTRRAGNGDGVVAFEQENMDANVLVTPAARKRAPAVSLSRKKEVEVVEDEEEKIKGNEKPINLAKTSAAVPSSRTRATGARKTEGTSVRQGYNTRRSVRLLEKNLSKMSLMDAEDNGTEKIDDVSEEISSFSQQIEDSADTEEVSDAGANLKAVTDVVLEETNEQEVSSMEMKTESECQVHDLGSEVQVVSVVKETDVEPLMEAESEEEDGSCLKADFLPNETNVKLEGSSETLEDSNEVDKAIGESAAHGGDEGSELLSELEDGDKSEDEKDIASPDGVIEQNASNVSSSDEPLKEDCDCEVELHYSEVLSSEVDENIEEDSEIKMEDCEESLEGGFKMDNASDLFDLPSVLASENLTVNANSELLEKSSMVEEEKLTDDASDVTGASSAEEYETEDEELDDNNASEKDNANPNSDYSLDVTEEGTNVEDVTLQSSVLNDELKELDAKSEPLEESMVEEEKVVDGASSAAMSLEKDASESYANLAAQVCTEISADVTLESSLVHVAVQEAEEEDNSESNDDAAAEEIANHDDSLSVPSLNPEMLVEVDHSSEVVISEVHGVAEEVATDEASLSVLSFNCDTAVKGDVSSEVVIEDKEQNEEPNDSAAKETAMDDTSMHVLSFNPNMLVKASNAPTKSVVADETQTVESIAIMKENLTTDELQQKSIRELKKMMKKLGLNNNNTAGKEVERKRTALQVLPENQNTPKAATKQ
ncbi:hypothetical protein PIB30_029858 [Stylosanthes scabra]|uniref:Uncharacterized protein n=1 Tax=Stylosanthes scabra TaxID=79078 RepID=A0ABU6YBK4_9FABA|nr:hypothetical protein [Stylosanthes scabra]